VRVRVDLGHEKQVFVDVAVEQPVRLVVLASNQSSTARARDLVDALHAALLVLTRDARELDVDLLPANSPEERQVVVWVGDDQRPNAAVETSAEQWLAGDDREAVSVLPRGLSNAYAALPDSLAHLHAVFGDAQDVATEVLGAAGLIPRDQRVFVSYSHSDGRELAHAIFDLLQRGRFEVFLDVASLEPGRRFAERIEHALVDKAFLVLIETGDAVGSEWVRREVNLARGLRLGLAAIHPTNEPALMAGIGSARRLYVDDDAELVCQGEPTDEGRRVLRFLRELHARAMVRRRASIENSLVKALSEVHLKPSRAGGGFALTTPGRAYSLDLQPRPAALADFERLDRRAQSDRAVLISPRTRGAPERAALEWLASRSGIYHAPETRMRSLARAIAGGGV
jgi:hypothetical protein